MKRIYSMIAAFLLSVCGTVSAQQINDNNTPLHLMKPAYRVGYSIPKEAEVKQTLDRLLHYIDQQTPTVLIDKRTGKEITVPACMVPKFTPAKVLKDAVAKLPVK